MQYLRLQNILRGCISRSRIYTHRAKSDQTSNMGMKSYWDVFYHSRKSNNPGGTNSFEWFFPYSETQDVFKSALSSVAATLPNNDIIHIAELGCGTSELAAELIQDYQNDCCVTCVDFSLDALEHNRYNIANNVKFQNSGPSRLAYVGADVCRLPFCENSFDLVFEKGTMDALLKSERTRMKSDQFLLEALRVLRPGGMFLQFSDEAPELRLDLLEKIKRQIRQRENKSLSVSFQHVSHNEALEYFVYMIHCGKL